MAARKQLLYYTCSISGCGPNLNTDPDRSIAKLNPTLFTQIRLEWLYICLTERRQETPAVLPVFHPAGILLEAEREMVLVPEAGQLGDRVALKQHNERTGRCCRPALNFLLRDFSNRGLI